MLAEGPPTAAKIRCHRGGRPGGVRSSARLLAKRSPFGATGAHTSPGEGIRSLNLLSKMSLRTTSFHTSGSHGIRHKIEINGRKRRQEFQRAYQMLAVLCGSTHQYTASPYNKLWQVTNGNSTNSASTNGTADAVVESAKLA
eukprot:s1408_g18.t1